MSQPEDLLAAGDEEASKRAEAEQNLEANKSSIRPQTQLPEATATPPEEIGHGGQTVSYLLARHTFMDYFAHVANRRYQHATPEGRMNRMISDHKWWYRICFWLDVVVKSVVISGLTVAAIAVFVKAIS